MVVFLFYPSKKDSHLDKKINKLIEEYCPNEAKYVLPNDQENFYPRLRNLQNAYI